MIQTEIYNIFVVSVDPTSSQVGSPLTSRIVFSYSIYTYDTNIGKQKIQTLKTTL